MINFLINSNNAPEKKIEKRPVQVHRVSIPGDYEGHSSKIFNFSVETNFLKNSIFGTKPYGTEIQENRIFSAGSDTQTY